jgi:putative ABC transport system permease protein
MSTLPFGTNLQTAARVWSIGGDPNAAQSPLMAASTPGVFSALGVSIVRGRPFDQRDVAGALPVAVVSEKLARSLFGTVEAEGLQLQMRGSLNALDDKTIETRTVIGVSRDTDEGGLMRRDGDGLLFLPIAQRYEPPNYIVAAGDHGAAALRAFVQAADAGIALDGVGSGFIMMGGAWNAARILAAIAVALGVITLLLTMAGLSGLLSHLVLRRTREIGIRKALGADASAIRWMVMRDGFRPVVTGMIGGLLLGMIGGFLVRAAMPVEALPVQPIAILIVIVAIVPATLAACYLPARRAVRVDPNLTLKDL